MHMVRCQTKALRPVEWGSGNMTWGSALIPQCGSSPKNGNSLLVLLWSLHYLIRLTKSLTIGDISIASSENQGVGLKVPIY